MITEDINDLKTIQRLVLPGICKVFAMPKDMVLDMPNRKLLLKKPGTDIDFISLNSLSLKPEAQWLDISIENELNTELKEKDNASSQNKYFQYEMPFTMPGDDIERARVIQTFDKREFILAIFQANKVWRLLGNKFKACTFTSELATGMQTKHGSINDMFFAFESKDRAPYIKEPIGDLDLYIDFFSDNEDGTFSIDFPLINATGTISVDVQLWNGKNWISIGTLTGITNGFRTETFTYSFAESGTYIIRLKTSTNQYSSPYEVSVTL